MAASHAIPELDSKGLRGFGLTTGAILVGIFGLALPWLLGANWPLWPWLVAAPLWALALASPSLLRAVYRAWMRFGLVASRITTPLVLGVVYFLLITPQAIVRRIAGKDALQRSFDRSCASYRVLSKKAPPDRLEKPF